jgi:hypothetical protein
MDWHIGLLHFATARQPLPGDAIDPEAYFRDILNRIPNHKINRITELLPWNWKANQIVYLTGRLLENGVDGKLGAVVADNHASVSIMNTVNADCN